MNFFKTFLEFFFNDVEYRDGKTILQGHVQVEKIKEISEGKNIRLDSSLDVRQYVELMASDISYFNLFNNTVRKRKSLDGYNINDEKYQRLRKKILDSGNDSIRNFEEDLNNINL